MKIFFTVYVTLIIGVLSLAFLLPKAQEEVAAHVDSGSTALPSLPTSLSSPDSSTIKSNGIKTAPPKPIPKAPVLKPAPSTTASLPTAGAASATPQETPVPKTVPVLSFSEEVEQEIHILVNNARVAHGLVALVWDSSLTVLARTHSVDMLKNNYLTHDDSLGCSATCRITNAGYLWSAAGENIYMMSGFTLSAKEAAEMVVEGWMKSPRHRANILSTAYTNQGVGVAVAGKTLYATEDFAKPR